MSSDGGVELKGEAIATMNIKTVKEIIEAVDAFDIFDKSLIKEIGKIKINIKAVKTKNLPLMVSFEVNKLKTLVILSVIIIK